MANAERLPLVSCSTAPWTILGMFAKHWRPGFAKSRLAVSVGEACAAKISRAFVETLLARFRDAAESRVIGFAPAGESLAFREIVREDWGLWPQPDGDLGQRIAKFFALAWAEAPYTVLIGSDSPDLPRSFVEEAFEALKSHQVVLGPAADGGYYLVGVAGAPPPIFDGVAWGTAAVWEQTVARLRAAGCSFHVLPEWQDVDDEGSLNALLGRLAEARDGDVHLARLFDQIKGLLSEWSAR